jgi:hypothetical protein
MTLRNARRMGRGTEERLIGTQVQVKKEIFFFLHRTNSFKPGLIYRNSFACFAGTSMLPKLLVQ